MKDSDDKISSDERRLRGDTLPLLDMVVGDHTVSMGENGYADVSRAGLNNLIGTVIDGKYKIRALIGIGGLSAVYEAFHEEMGRRVAVKVLLPQWSSDAIQVKRFRREAHFLSQINHSSIAAVHSCGLTDKNELYLTMEFVEGITLDQFLAKQRLTAAQCCELFMMIAEAVAFAHGKAIIHRDLKPQNIMICSSEAGYRVKVLDFGIAKMFSDQANQKLTATGSVVGSPVYMSPEQFTGKQTGAAADIYSFGCVLYQALAGHAPFVYESVFEYMNAHVNEAPPEIPFLSKVDTDPERRSLAGIAYKCLAKDPAHRFASMDEVYDALKRTQESPTIAINFADTLPRIEKKKDYRAVKRFAITAALGLLAVLAYPLVVRLLWPPPHLESQGDMARRGFQLFDEADHESNSDRRLQLRHQAAEKFAAAIVGQPREKTAEIRNLLGHCLREMRDEPEKLEQAKLIFKQLLKDQTIVQQHLKDESSKVRTANVIVDCYNNLGILSLLTDKNYHDAEVYFTAAKKTQNAVGESDFGPVWGLEVTYRYQKKPQAALKLALENIEILKMRHLDDWYKALMLADAVVDIKEAHHWNLQQAKDFVRARFVGEVSELKAVKNDQLMLYVENKVLADPLYEHKRAWEIATQTLLMSPKPNFLD